MSGYENRQSPKQVALAKLWGNFNQANLPNNLWRAWEPNLEEFSDREVEQACQKIMNSDMQRPPRWVDFRRFLPGRSADSTPGKGLRWWAVSGEFGGNWADADGESVRDAALDMIKNGFPKKDIHKARRVDFLMMAIRRGAISLEESKLQPGELK